MHTYISSKFCKVLINTLASLVYIMSFTNVIGHAKI